ncbi:hypothetical protein BCR33DRAFT_215873 [Rhizoclosmatium globosum]|uniref:Uncharacterized protein n=1 Tax=Rhizoclosmatium globosum TaxID=329046 RepID=A0A1Y2AF37_9FUNG|nr:hypothetical protein BCR33DRAFT_215873 [Rhizoclosmatium globosum]|eukprot:ORY21082.1 hypothetical protein BCR33DRAFT_215873 [Rhizoclosmatium globosum]
MGNGSSKEVNISVAAVKQVPSNTDSPISIPIDQSNQPSTVTHFVSLHPSQNNESVVPTHYEHTFPLSVR